MAQFVLMILLLSGLVGTSQAQEPYALDEMPEREIITVLRMGADIFEPNLWQASAVEYSSSTTATFQSTLASGLSALSFINYMHFDLGYTADDLTEFFNQTWFEETFVNWEDVQHVATCTLDDLTLYEFDMAYRDSENNLTRYGVRYWVQPMTETRVRAWHIAFSITRPDGTQNMNSHKKFDLYSARIYPDLPACPVESTEATAASTP